MLPLAREIILSLFDADLSVGVLYWKVKLNRRVVVGSIAGTTTPAGYRRVKINGKNYFVQHLLFMIAHNRWPSRIDHEDLVKNNNGIDNLREATPTQNNANHQPRRANKFKGVFECKDTRKKRFRVSVQAAGAVHRLGYFATAEEAARKYDAKAVELFGEFARVNFPAELG